MKLKKRKKQSNRKISEKRKFKSVNGGSRNATPQDSNPLQQAVHFQQAGRLAEAEKIYRHILTNDPENADANHLLGLLAMQVGKNDEAVTLITKALEKGANQAIFHNNLGVAYKELGKFDEAKACYQKAIQLNNNYAEAHNNLGVVLKNLGHIDDAINYYNHALVLFPNYVEALFNLGVAHQEKEKFSEAMTFYQKALKIKPNYPEALNNLGLVYQNSDELESAEEALRKALQIKHKYLEALINLGDVLVDQERLAEAEETLHKAILWDSKSAKAHAALGAILMQKGELDEAQKCIRQAIDLKPDYAAAHYTLARAKKHTARDQDVEDMETLLAHKDITTEQRAQLNFALAKVYEELAEFDKSFDFLQTANTLVRKERSCDIASIRKNFNELKLIFSHDVFKRYKGCGCQDATPIFILGMPRSGSTLVEQTLSSHAAIHGAGELKIIKEMCTDRVFAKITGQTFPIGIRTVQPDILEKLGLRYIKRLRRYSETADRITDKMPHNFLQAGLIKLILPHAKIIHCRRHPVDNCLSIYKQFFNKFHNYAYDLKELGEYYTLYEDLMRHWHSIMPGHIFDINYEDMVADHEERTKEILEFCQLPWDENCLQFHQSKRPVKTASLAQVRRPIYTDSVQLWKQYEKNLSPLITALQL